MIINNSSIIRTHFVFRIFRALAYSLAVVTLISCLSIGNPGQAQSATGGIVGVVRDPTGALVPGASVTIKNTETNVATKYTTNNAGAFHASGLLPGFYEITVEKEGFAKNISKAIRIENGVIKLEVTLEAGKISEVVEVNIKAENIILENGSSVGMVIPQDSIARLPLVNSNVLDLVKVMGGVVMSENPIFSADDKTLAGLSAANVNVQKDGVTANNVRWVPGPDGKLHPIQQVRTRFNTEAYDHVLDNPFMNVLQNPLSTFSIDVDSAAYSNMRRFLNGRSLPPKDSVRIEELVNYFDYDYAGPKDNKPFTVHFELTEAPWKTDHLMLRIALKGREIETGNRPPSNLVFLLDVSGSMMAPNKLPLVQQSMRLLVDKLTESDKVAIVVYAGATAVRLPSTSGDQKAKISQAIDGLMAGGSTNGASGLQLAYQVAQDGFIKGGANRVLLATDGDFNVGITNRGDLTRLIEEKANSGIFLSALGFGMGNYKDSTLELLAAKGRGNYAYIDTLNEAKKVLVDQMNSTLVTIAKDVKIQVEFNPNVVGAYRLIGYEDRIMPKEDFNNDAKMAGAIGAGHTVTALYEITPVGKEDPSGVDSLKYQKPSKLSSSKHGKEMLTLKIRSKEPEGEKSVLSEYELKNLPKKFVEATEDCKFAAAVAAFGMVLRDSPYKGNSSMENALLWAKEGKGIDRHGYRDEFISLIHRAISLSH